MVKYAQAWLYRFYLNNRVVESRASQQNGRDFDCSIVFIIQQPRRALWHRLVDFQPMTAKENLLLNHKNYWCYQKTIL